MHFLDSRTLSADDIGPKQLHEILIQAYDDEYEALALAGQCGLLRADIARHPKLRYTWWSILEEVAKEGRLRKLVDDALRDRTISRWHVEIRRVIDLPPGVAVESGEQPVVRTTNAPSHEMAPPRVGDKADLWNLGTTLHVRFLDGASSLHSRVESVAMQWTEYANIKFEFDGDPNAPIRISFALEGTWSFEARACLNAAANEPTMNFGWLNARSPTSEIERVVLHEFGHVLGLRHEHGNPASEIEWNRPKVYEMYTGPPNYWTREQVDETIFAIWPPHYYPVRKVFDSASIMIFPQPADHLLRGVPIGWNTQLSAVDKQFAAALYPLGERR
jgi:Effector-associated domain 1